MGAMARPIADKRRCVFCGKHIAAHLTQCPFCREAVPQVQLSRRTGPDGRRQIRRGLLYMLLAGGIPYFSAGYADPLNISLPAPLLPLVTQYGTPLLFLGGLVLAVFGVLSRIRH